MKNILVLGANGFIGSHLVNKLRETNEVIGYGRGAQSKHNCRVFLERNFVEENEWKTILSEYNIDTIYHFISTTSPAVGTAKIESEIADNLLPTLRLLEAMKGTNANRIIFASSGGTIYGNGNSPHKTADPLHPISSYGVQKVTIEAYLEFYHRIYGLKCLIARIANPYGLILSQNRTQGIIPIFLRCLLEHKPVVIFGNTIRDYIYIDDVVDALIKLGHYCGINTIFNIGTGIGTELQYLVVLLEQITGKHFAQIIQNPQRSCDVLENILDVSETENTLQWRYKTELEQGIMKTWVEMCKWDKIRRDSN